MKGRLEAARDDRGTVIPLILIFTLVASLLLLVVIDSTVLFVRSRSIGTVADGAALAAAQEIDQNTLYTTGGIKGSDLPIDKTQQVGQIGRTAQQAVDKYVADNDVLQRFPGFESATASFDPDTGTNRVVVTISVKVQLPFVSWLTTRPDGSIPTDGIRITEAASAVLRCGDKAGATCG